MNHDELVLNISKAVDEVRTGVECQRPVWAPLEAVLPGPWLDGWMFMGTENARVMQDNYERRPIFLYKHGITRKYLNIGSDLGAYIYMPHLCEIGDPLYQRMNLAWMIEVAYSEIEKFGATRETRYDTDFIRNRNAALQAAGYTVIG